MARPDQKMNLDELVKSAGDTGPYQIVVFLILGIFTFSATDSISINFLAAKMDHWCYVPGLENYSHAQQREIGIPGSETGLNPGYSHCHRYPGDFTRYSKNTSMNNTDLNMTFDDSTTCSRWVYDKSVFVSTIVSQWDLVCDRSWLIDLVSTSYMAGRLVACLISGSISDRFGRKPTVVGFHALKLLGSVLSIYSPNYESFIISRFIIAFGSTGSTMATFVLLTEVTGDKWRHTFGIGWNALIAVGGMVLPAVAYFVRDYQYLQAVYTWPQFALLICIFSLDESPKWLASQGRMSEAIKILRKIAKVNGRPFPGADSVEIAGLQQQSVIRSRPRRCCDILTRPNLRMKTLILWLNWFTVALMYYALSLNTGRLPGDIFINTFFIMSVEIPANLVTILCMKRFGGPLTLAVFTLLAALASWLMIPFMFIADADVAVTVFAIAGKALITVSYNAVYIVTSEAYPTYFRTVGMGIAASFARISGMGSSFVGGYMMEIWRPLPSIIFGVLGMVSGGLVLLLPRAKVRRLPETMSEAENLGKQSQLVTIKTITSNTELSAVKSDDVSAERVEPSEVDKLGGSQRSEMLEVFEPSEMDMLKSEKTDNNGEIKDPDETITR